MKKFNSLKKALCLVLAMLMVVCVTIIPVSADDTAEHKHTPNQLGICTECDLNILERLNQAYIYSFPLVLMDVTKEKVTNTESATYTQAPINQFCHVPVFADANAKDIVLPKIHFIAKRSLISAKVPLLWKCPKPIAIVLCS